MADAREADGHPFRSTFAAAAGISKRSLIELEDGKPTVGQSVLQRVGRALATQGWDKDTPRNILEGGPIPQPPEAFPSAEAPAEPVDDPADPDAKIRRHLRELWDASPDEETFYRVVAEELAKVRAARGGNTNGERPTAEG